MLERSADEEKLGDLQQIETRVADHWGDARPAAQVHDAPEGAEQAGCDRRIQALNQMSRPERRAGHDHTGRAAAQPHVEPVADEVLEQVRLDGVQG